jgi:hypothetical protein
MDALLSSNGWQVPQRWLEQSHLVWLVAGWTVVVIGLARMSTVIVSSTASAGSASLSEPTATGSCPPRLLVGLLWLTGLAAVCWPGSSLWWLSHLSMAILLSVLVGWTAEMSAAATWSRRLWLTTAVADAGLMITLVGLISSAHIDAGSSSTAASIRPETTSIVSSTAMLMWMVCAGCRLGAIPWLSWQPVAEAVSPPVAGLCAAGLWLTGALQWELGRTWWSGDPSQRMIASALLLGASAVSALLAMSGRDLRRRVLDLGCSSLLFGLAVSLSSPLLVTSSSPDWLNPGTALAVTVHLACFLLIWTNLSDIPSLSFTPNRGVPTAWLEPHRTPISTPIADAFRATWSTSVATPPQTLGHAATRLTRLARWQLWIGLAGLTGLWFRSPDWTFATPMGLADLARILVAMMGMIAAVRCGRDALAVTATQRQDEAGSWREIAAFAAASEQPSWWVRGAQTLALIGFLSISLDGWSQPVADLLSPTSPDRAAAGRALLIWFTTALCSLLAAAGLHHLQATRAAAGVVRRTTSQRLRDLIDLVTLLTLNLPVRAAAQLARFADWFLIDSLIDRGPRALQHGIAALGEPLRQASPTFVTMSVVLGLGVWLITLLSW